MVTGEMIQVAQNGLQLFIKCAKTYGSRVWFQMHGEKLC